MKEFEYLKKFARGADFTQDIMKDLFCCLWTAFCLHENLMVGTILYDHHLAQLWKEIMGDEDPIGWASYFEFYQSVSKFLG